MGAANRPPPTPTSQPKLPARIGKYEVLMLVATGGMARLYLGRATGEGGFQKLVAIKQILPHLMEEEDFVRMFMDEARISAQLGHSNISQIFEFGTCEESYFIAMEYVHGVDMRRLLHAFSHASMAAPPALAAYIMAQVCTALEYAHTRTDARGQPLGIIHRDVSPSNVLVSFEGEVKLIDFGIAKAAERHQETMAGTFKGKYAYLSPEQVLGKALDHRSDVFTAGILLYELIAGEHPFRRDDDFSTLRAVRAAHPRRPSLVNPEVPRALEQICGRALRANPDDRYASAGDMEQELEAFRVAHPLSRRELARWMQRTFARERMRRERAMGGRPELAAGETLLGEEGSGSGRSPGRGTVLPPLDALTPTGNSATGPGLHGAATVLLQADREAPSEALAPDALTEVLVAEAPLPATPTPLADPPHRPMMKRPWRIRVLFTVVLALALATALGSQVYRMVTRGPRLAPLPEAAPVLPDAAVVATHQLSVLSAVKGVTCRVTQNGREETRRPPFLLQVREGATVEIRATRHRFRPVTLRWTSHGDRTLRLLARRHPARLVVGVVGGRSTPRDAGPP